MLGPVRRRAIVGVALALAWAPAAAAQEFAPITDRDFALDLYSGAALGSLRTVGMGGAAVAIAEGSAGSIANPAAPAVRAETSSGTWDWDWHFDYLSTGLGSDADNNGIAGDRADGPFAAPVLTLGLALQYGAWGVALSGTASQQPAEAPDGTKLKGTALLGRLAVARTLLGGDLAVGAALRLGSFEVATDAQDEEVEEAEALFGLSGTSLEAGAVWAPRGRTFRLGASAALPVAGDRVEVADGCDPLDCEGFVVPRRAVVPWQVAVGGAWRVGPTPWNRRVAGRWRDERAWLVAADVVVTGRTTAGHGLEAYAQGQLQRSGRHAVWSPRGGVEREWIPGWLRARAGAYWEPSRFEGPDGDAVPGRVHGTFGVDGRVWSFCLWRERYRLRLSLTGDAARRYFNGGLSLGLWH
jgi:hypothetical protein